MADAFELVALALPGGVAPESLPAIVRQFVADCWPGMSRSQLIARAGAFRCGRRCVPIARVRRETSDTLRSHLWRARRPSP